MCVSVDENDGFSAMLVIKNKYGSKFELKPDLCLKLSLVKSDVEELCKSKHAQCLHKN